MVLRCSWSGASAGGGDGDATASRWSTSPSRGSVTRGWSTMMDDIVRGDTIAMLSATDPIAQECSHEERST